jgi:acyl phosphate:glycerol-3-phosphate acyltransferase
MKTVCMVAVAYLFGSLPVGVWVGRWAGVDVRHAGSGNIGATNVARTVGRRAGLLTLFADVAKGALPAVLARLLFVDAGVLALVGLAAVCGHVFSVFLRFSGGKGVATAFGAFAVLTPVAAALSAAVFAAAAISTRYVSLASMLGAFALPISAVACRYPMSLCIVAAVVSTMIILRHRDNLARLIRGVEPQFGVQQRN